MNDQQNKEDIEDIEQQLDDLNEEKSFDDSHYVFKGSTIKRVLGGITATAFVVGAFCARAFLNIRR